MKIRLLLAIPAFAFAATQGTVRSGHLPVPGASVTLRQGKATLSTTTDETGAFLVDRVAAGPCHLEVEMFGFVTDSRDLPDCSTPIAVDLKLKPPSQTPVAGTARRPNSPNGFQRLSGSQNVQNEIQSALNAATRPDSPALTGNSQNANESFLVSGSLSRGLQAPQEADFGPGMMGGPGTMGGPGIQRVPGQGGMGRPGGAMASGPPGGVGPGGGPMMGGGGPMGGGPRGGGFGGRGGFARRGGFGGPGAGPEGFGNRRNRGRDTIRGAAFFTLRNSALDARNYSLTGQTVDKPSYSQPRFGVTLGGPLRIPKLIDSDKTFFFLNWTGTRSRSPFSSVATVPTALERAGDFSQSVSSGIVYDPITGLPFPGNVIPTSRLNSASTGLLNYIPLPNQTGAIQNYQFVTSIPQNSDNLGVRLNHSPTSKDRLAAGINLQRRSGESAQTYGYIDESSGSGYNVDFSWVRNIHAGLVNSARLSFNRNSNSTLPYFAYGEDVAAQLGITGTSSVPINYGPPNLTFTNFGSLTDASPVSRHDQSVSLGESILWVHGKHNFTFGGDYRRIQINSISDSNARGTFTFTGLVTSALDSTGQAIDGTGFDLADFLLGLPQSSSIRFGNADTYFRAPSYSAYVQDDWRIRSNLSLNLGLRYEFQPPFTEKYGRMANLDIAYGFTGVAAVLPETTGVYTGAFPSALIDSDKNNFSPRVGLAWRPFAKKSVQFRAGYGIYYNGSVYNQLASRLAQQPPFAQTGTVTTSIANILTLENGFTATPSQDITNTYAVDRGYRVGYAQTWSSSIQTELPHHLLLEVGYLGTKGTRLDIQRLPNRAAPGSTLTAEERRRISNAVGFTFDSAVGNSIYHSGQLRLMRRFGRGVSFNALYTYAKSIDNASTFGGGGAVVAQNDQDLSAERGLSTFDMRHTLNLNFMLSSPVGEGNSLIVAHGLTARLLSGWNLGGGTTARSGLPLTAMVSGNRADTAGTGTVGSGRADSTGVELSGGRFFNTSAFTTPPSGRFGNAGRNTIPGPSLFAINLSFGRSFSLGERRRLEFRADSTNTTNFVSFTRVGTTVNASEYGLPTAASAMRTITLQMRLRF